MVCFAIMYYTVAFKLRNVFDYNSLKYIYHNLQKYILHCDLVILTYSYKEPKHNLTKHTVLTTFMHSIFFLFLILFYLKNCCLRPIKLVYRPNNGS